MHRAPFILLLHACTWVPLHGQSATPEASKSHASGTAVPGNQATTTPASWRKRYELGPGDVINFSLFGRPELSRPGFRVAPDGTVSYLQAQDIKVTGLTLDEARLAIEKGLKTNPKIKLGICGEHGGDPVSVKFCNKVGLTYVSCSPFRVPVARLAAAQAVLEQAK